MLYLNNGDGTFKDISKQAGIDAPNWSSGGAMLDYDNDGFLDIYVTNYGRWNYPEDHHRVGDAEKKVWLYASPRTIKTVKHLFYHNNRQSDVHRRLDKVITAEHEVEDPATKTKKKVRGPEPRDDGHGFGVVTADLNDDGLIDIFVANDMNPNFLFLNRGDGTFDDVSEISGAAYNINGKAQSGMGVDAEDVDGDGLPELFVTNFANEYSTLYQNFGNGMLLRQHRLLRPGVRLDALGQVGLCAWPTSTTTAGPTASSSTATSTTTAASSASRSTTRRSRSSSATLSGKRFRLATRDAGPYFDTKHVGRGRGLRRHRQRRRHRHRRQPQGRRAGACSATTPSPNNHWIRFVLQGTKSNRDAIGAEVRSRSSRIRRAGRSTASARGATACRRPTIRASPWGSARPT